MGDREEPECPTHILWPWDVLRVLYQQNQLEHWIADEPERAGVMTAEYWHHSKHLEFFERLNLQESDFGSCIPLFFHVDAVRVYKNQKLWVYSLASAVRKGPSIKTKIIFALVRDTMLIKDDTHHALGKIVGYITKTLKSGCFPSLDYSGKAFRVGSKEALRAGTRYAGPWFGAFSAFKGDWEARRDIHRMQRHYNATWICEHCLASRQDAFTFGDFREEAACLRVRFSHEDFLMLNNPSKQSSCVCVEGWTKDRNLEDPKL